MTDKELKRLSRRELLEMLIAQGKQLQILQKKLDDAEAALRSKEITMNKAGSIAEAALRLNGVFEAAEAACAQYLESVQALERRQKAICTQMEKENTAKVRKRKADTEHGYETIEAKEKDRNTRHQPA